MVSTYVGMADRLLVATDDGGDWQVGERLQGRGLECVAVARARPERVLVGTFESGIQRSTDGGDTFERVGAATVDEAAVTALAVSPHDPDVVWAGTEPSTVYLSSDGGATWAVRPGLADLDSADSWSFPPRPHTHHVRWIEPDPNDPDRVYLGIEAGAFVRTTDGGETWQDHPEGARRDNHTMATHPDAEGLVYAAAGDGFAVSRDAGETWSYPQSGLDHRYCWSVVADPGDPDRVVLSAARGARQAHYPEAAETYVYRREGRGREWERLDGDGGLPTGTGVLRAVLATTGETGVVYAATDRGLWRSTDFGASWTELAVSWPEAVRDQPCHGLALHA
jgi:photosystem II stability/assembly factor-like uncharacterized protein